MAIQKNKIYRAEIVDYTAEGSGVARIVNPEARYSLWGSMNNIQTDLLPEGADF